MCLAGVGGTSQGNSTSPGVPTPHAAPPLPQVVAIDLDEGLNGLVSYRMQVGMPRMDFLINSSSGVVVTTTELDRERIAQYQLRVVATDEGTPTKSSTSTLTIRGEQGGGASCCVLNTQQGGEPTCTPAGHCPRGHPRQLEPFNTAEPFLSYRVEKASEPLPTWPLPSVPQSPGQWLGPTAKAPFSDPGNSREGLSRGEALRVTNSLGRLQSLCLL